MNESTLAGQSFIFTKPFILNRVVVDTRTIYTSAIHYSNIYLFACFWTGEILRKPVYKQGKHVKPRIAIPPCSPQ